MNKNLPFCKYVLLFFLTIFVFACGGGGGDSGSQPVTPLTPPGDIAFESFRSGVASDVYLMHEDGTGVVNVTDSIGGYSPAWSADGMKLAFASNSYDIWTVKWMSTGRFRTNLTLGLIHGTAPKWSPNGLYIIYSWSGCILQSNLSSSRTLTCNSDSGGRYNPAGDTIAFVSSRTGHLEIYTMDNNGANQVNLTSSIGNSHSPSWHPSGTKIVFVSDRDGNNEIYIMNSDGSGQTNLTLNAASDFSPLWNPAGDKIIFVSNRDGIYQIYKMNPDGTGLVRLSSGLGNDDSPCWNVNGTKIAFVSDRDGNEEIYIMNSDGSNQKNISNNPSSDINPVWRP